MIDRTDWVWVDRRLLPRGLEYAVNMGGEMLVPPDTVLRSIDITTVADTARGVTVAMLLLADGRLTDPVMTVN